MTSNIIYKAILSMDAYNRGYGAGINLSSDKLGSISIMKTTTADGKIINFDSSTFVGADGKPIDDDIGFYAIAYETASGEKIISYRGTNVRDWIFKSCNLN